MPAIGMVSAALAPRPYRDAIPAVAPAAPNSRSFLLLILIIVASFFRNVVAWIGPIWVSKLAPVVLPFRRFPKREFGIAGRSGGARSYATFRVIEASLP